MVRRWRAVVPQPSSNTHTQHSLSSLQAPTSHIHTTKTRSDVAVAVQHIIIEGARTGDCARALLCDRFSCVVRKHSSTRRVRHDTAHCRRIVRACCVFGDTDNIIMVKGKTAPLQPPPTSPRTSETDINANTTSNRHSCRIATVARRPAATSPSPQPLQTTRTPTSSFVVVACRASDIGNIRASAATALLTSSAAVASGSRRHRPARAHLQGKLAYIYIQIHIFMRLYNQPDRIVQPIHLRILFVV